MLVHPNFDPVALDLGVFQIHWYGVMYVLGFLGVYFASNYRVKQHPILQQQKWSADRISDLIFYGAIGTIIGGRLGYVLFYKPLDYLQDPLQIFMINQGGMSFHGGLLGVAVGLFLFAKKYHYSFIQVADFIAPVAPIGLFFGRLGNFINQELWGKASDVPWAMVFQKAGSEARHPSMLYEAILEGVLLFIVLIFLSRRLNKPGFLTGVFLFGYALSRMLVELVRIPDEHLSYLLFGWVTMGHILSLPMLIGGMYLIFRKQNIK